MPVCDNDCDNCKHGQCLAATTERGNLHVGLMLKTCQECGRKTNTDRGKCPECGIEFE